MFTLSVFGFGVVTKFCCDSVRHENRRGLADRDEMSSLIGISTKVITIAALSPLLPAAWKLAIEGAVRFEWATAANEKGAPVPGRFDLRG